MGLFGVLVGHLDTTDWKLRLTHSLLRLSGSDNISVTDQFSTLHPSITSQQFLVSRK